MLAPSGVCIVDDDIGLDRPVREGIEDLKCGDFVIDEEETPADIKEDGEATSEEEKEAGGIPRIKRGAQSLGEGSSASYPQEGHVSAAHYRQVVFLIPADGPLNIAASQILRSLTAFSARLSRASWSAPRM